MVSLIKLALFLANKKKVTVCASKLGTPLYSTIFLGTVF